MQNTVMSGKRPVHPLLRLFKATAGVLLSATIAGSTALAQHIGRTPQAPGRLLHTNLPLQVETLVQGLVHPWGMALLPEHPWGILITERPGTLRLWREHGGLSAPIQGVPVVFAQGQGGLLDIALSPDFAQDRRVYLSYAAADPSGRAATHVGYGRLSEDEQRLENFTVILRQTPALSTGHHFGARLVFDRKGMLFITLGENNQRSAAQDLNKLQGKVLRLHPDGRIPQDNPFVHQAGARPEIWSWGHRNPQGAALHPETKQLWVHEHGPRGGDEINIPMAGANYGWPLATYGRNYSGFAIPEALGSSAPGTQAPHYYWEVSPAISGMAFYDFVRFPAWRQSLFIGALKEKALIRLQLDGDRIVGEEWLLRELNVRIRDVRVGSDGYLYILTDHRAGKLLRVGLEEDDSAAPYPVLFPLDLPEIRAITVTNASVDGRSTEEKERLPEFVLCKNFRVSPHDMEDFFKRTKQISRNNYSHAIDWMPCRAVGDVYFVDGTSAHWMVMVSGAGVVIFPDGRETFLYCDQCTAPFIQ